MVREWLVLTFLRKYLYNSSFYQFSIYDSIMLNFNSSLYTAQKWSHKWRAIKINCGKRNQFRGKLVCCTTKYGSSRNWVALLFISRTLIQWFVCTPGMWNGLLSCMLLCGLILFYIVWIFSFVHFRTKCIEKVYAQCQFV